MGNLVVGRPAAPTLKRGPSRHKLEREHSHAPNVDTVSVLLSAIPPDHLWGQVVESATHCLASVGGGVHTPPEIGQLDHTQAIEKVLGLDVPMDDVLRVDVLERFAHLKDVVSCPLLVVAASWLALEVFVQFALRTVLQDQVDPIVVIEEAIQLHHVLMPQVALYLDLSTQLMRNRVLEQLALEEDLERDYELGFLLSCQVDMSELTSAERPPNFKVFDSPLCAIKLADLSFRNCG